MNREILYIYIYTYIYIVSKNRGTMRRKIFCTALFVLVLLYIKDTDQRLLVCCVAVPNGDNAIQ
jgi:hypothetical protein